MFPATFELVTNKSDAVQPHPHSKLLIFLLDFPVTGAFLCQRLMIERECQHDICPDLSGMKRTVEPPQFHRVVAMEETVQVKKMIAALVIVTIAAAGVILIPD